MQIVRFEGAFRLPWRAIRDANDQWTGICEPLALTVQGETWVELCENIAESLNLMLLGLLKTGDLEHFLQDRGWRLATPIDKFSKDLQFDVPCTVTTAREAGFAAQEAVH